MNIIGIGNGGCCIADLFSQYPEYKIYKIDVGIKGKNCFSIPKKNSIEEYEDNIPEIKLLGKLKGDATVILAGGGEISGITLRILEKIKHLKVDLLYIRPDSALISNEKKIRDKVVFGILQEYARSSLINRIVIISNSQVENLLGGLSITEYYESINQTIVTTFHMINYLLTGKEVFGKMSSTREIDRISTVGIYNIEDGQEAYLYKLSQPMQKVFLYAIGKEDLTQNKNLTKLIQQQTKEAYSGTEIDISYKITTTNYDTNFVYLVANTNIIQQ